MKGGDGGERGAVWRHGPGAGPEEDLEPGGEAVLIGPCKADGDRLLHVCADLAGRHDAQHCGGDAVPGVCVCVCARACVCQRPNSRYTLW